LEFYGSLPAQLFVARGGEHHPASLGELAGDLEADALVCSGNQGDFFCFLHVFLLSLSM
jgi:hypothetical protein